MSDNTLSNVLKVLHCTDGTINLYIRHDVTSWGEGKIIADKTRHLVNHIRKTFPKIPNEVRRLPSHYYEKQPRWSIDNFCFYGLTKSEFMMLKLAWTFKERLMSTKMSRKHTDEHFLDKAYRTPSGECKRRFAREGYRQSLLKIKS